ncbi:MAG: ROK family protein [Chloroflexota bacterium]|nr:ROK family protein [Chloroflexota bacterium]
MAQKSKEDELILGVDLGGTKIATALASARGKILARGYKPTLAQEGPASVIGNILGAMDETISRGKVEATQLSGIGIAAAGIIDPDNGKVIFSPNLPGWHEVPLKDIIQQHFDIPTYVGNDASLAALGEWLFGLKKKVSHLIYVTVSTGIGGGIIAAGKLYTGASGIAGEVGHMTVDVNGPHCNCGNIGCWETLASGTALAKEAVREITQGKETSIIELVQGDVSRIDAKIIFQAAQQGDKLALELISRLGFYLGVGLVNLVNIFNPELILIGGGVAKMGDLLLKPAIRVVRERAFTMGKDAVKIKPALLRDDSCVLGAVAFVLEQLSAYSSG